MPRRKYYRERYDEFRKANALPLTRDVALAFNQAGHPMTDARLTSSWARDSAQGARASDSPTRHERYGMTAPKRSQTMWA